MARHGLHLLTILALTVFGCGAQKSPLSSEAGPASGLTKPTVTSFDVTFTFTGMTPPDVNVTNGGITKWKGGVVFGDVTGDLSGTLPHEFRTFSINTKTGNGEGQGTFVFYATVTKPGSPIDGLSGTFEGSFTTKLMPDGQTGSFVGQGTGGFEGMQIKFASERVVPGLFTMSGQILNPKG